MSVWDLSSREQQTILQVPVSQASVKVSPTVESPLISTAATEPEHSSSEEPAKLESETSLVAASQQEVRTMASSIWFYVPNVIGYIRVILAFGAVYVAFTDHQLFFAFYMSSQLLDALDGYAARSLGQRSTFGAVLDQVTDRASSAALLMILSQLYPAHARALIFLNALDLVSHYAHLYSTLIRGVASHKDIDSKRQGLILFYYYSSKAVLFSLCFGNEAFFLLSYAYYFSSGFLVYIPVVDVLVGIIPMCLYISFPLCIAKQIVNVIQLWQASCDLVELDEIAKKRGKSG